MDGSSGLGKPAISHHGKFEQQADADSDVLTAANDQVCFVLAEASSQDCAVISSFSCQCNAWPRRVAPAATFFSAKRLCQLLRFSSLVAPLQNRAAGRPSLEKPE